jgi:hypothetical protein
MSGSSGKRNQADEAIVDDGKSTQTDTAKTKTKSSGKDDSGQTSSGKDDLKQPPQNRNEPETHDDDESQRPNSFLNWLAGIEEHDIPFDSMPDLNIAYIPLLKDATRCEPSFPEFLRKGGGSTPTRISLRHSIPTLLRSSKSLAYPKCHHHPSSRTSLAHGHWLSTSRLTEMG